MDRSEIQLAPPTHRTLMVLEAARDVRGMLEIARRASLAPICPRLVTHDEVPRPTIALALPGDPEHEVRETRVDGPSRYVLRGNFWRSASTAAD